MSKGLRFFPEQASTIAGEIDALYLFLVAVGVFFTVLICALLMFMAIKYRRRSDLDRPEEIEGHVGLEVFWTVVPLMLCMVMFFWGAKLFFKAYTPPADASTVYVVGKQWMWKLQHANGRREINELHVPIGEPIRLVMASEDVLHSFYVPAFRMKQDVIPGMYTMTWFEANKLGEYHLFCAEYCGTKHSQMTGRIVVMTPTDYQNWMSGGSPSESMAEAGARLFTERACATCHTEVSGGLGPTLHNIYGKPETMTNGDTVMVDEAYLREAILAPAKTVVAGYAPVMPTFEGQLSEEALLQLIAYIKSLTPQPQEVAPSEEAPPPAEEAKETP